MSAPLDVAAVRAGWGEALATSGSPECARTIAVFACNHIPALLDHVEVLHAAIRRACTGDVVHPAAYLRTILDEVTT